MSRWKVFSTLLCTMIITISCGRQDRSSSQLDAYVSEDERNRAFSIIEGIDYIPFTFTQDGCYGRALYMAMELAIAEIPSSSLYIYGTLRPNPRLAWRFHVAPLLIDRYKQQTYVLDPTLATSPVSAEKWLQLVNPSAGYQTHIQDGSTYFTQVDLKKPQNIIDGFSELNSFRMSDVVSACQAMHSYLRYDNQGDINKRREKLLERTQELIDSLDQLGKLNHDRSVDIKRSCTRSFYF
ncbi:MAG: protein-glutamine glutaminase family protein [Oligoflexus sp.]